MKRQTITAEESKEAAPHPRPGGPLLTAGQVGELLGVPRSLGLRPIAKRTHPDRQPGPLSPLSQ